MSGACCAASCISASSVPLAAQIQLTNTSLSFNVAGASGNLYAALGAVIFVDASGGSGSYTASVTITKDGGSGTASIVASGDGTHNTVAWAGLAVGQTLLFHLKNHVDDGLTAVNALWPASGSISLTRTS